MALDFSQFGTPEAEEETLDFSAFGTPEGIIDAKRSRTWGEAASDTAVSFGRGAGALVEGAGTLYGLATGDMDNTVRNLGKDTAEYYDARKSDVLKAKEQARAEKVKSADGFWDEAGTALVETVKDPALMGSFLAEQIPMLVGPGVVGRAGAAVGGAKAAIGSAVGTGAAMQGGDVASDAFDEARKAALAQGMTPEQAEAEALEVARKAGATGAAVSVGAQMLPGGRAIERVLSGADKRVVGRVAGGVRGALGEGVSEAVEEAGGKVGANVALQNLEPDRPLLQGAGEAAGLGFAGGMGAGAVTGALEQPAKVEKTPEAAALDVLAAPDVESAIQAAEAALDTSYTKLPSETERAADRRNNVDFTPPEVGGGEATSPPPGPFGNEIEFDRPGALGLIDQARGRPRERDEFAADLQRDAPPANPPAIAIPGEAQPTQLPPTKTTQQEYASAIEKQSRGELLSSYERTLLDNPPQTPKLEVIESRPKDPERMTMRELVMGAKLTRSNERRAEISAEIERRSQETADASPVEVSQPADGGAVESQASIPSRVPVAPAVQAAQADGTGQAKGQVDGPAVQVQTSQAAPAPAASQPEGSGAVATPASPAPAFKDYTAPKTVGKVIKGSIRTFPTERGASIFRKAQGLTGYAPRQTEDGWVLSQPTRQRTPAQKANDERLKAKAKNVQPDDSLADLLRKSGGINARELTTDGADPKDLADSLRFGAFRKSGGLSLDAAAEIMAEAGYDVLDEAGRPDATKARDLIQNVLDGEKVYTAEGYEIRQQRDEAARARFEAQHNEQERAETGYAQASPEVKAVAAQIVDDTFMPDDEVFEELEEISDEELAKWQAEGSEDAGGPDAEGTGRSGEDRSPGTGAAQEEGGAALKPKFSRSGPAPVAVGDLVNFRIPHHTQATQPRAGTVKVILPDGRYEVRGQDGGIYKLRRDEIKTREEWLASKAELALTGETESEIRVREAQEKKAAADKTKRDNAPSEKGFTLTGSDRAVDVAEAKGQKALFAKKGEPKTLADFWFDYAQDPDAFQYPKSDATDAAELAKAYELGDNWKVGEKARSYRVPNSFEHDSHKLLYMEARKADGTFAPYLEVNPDPVSPEDTVFIRINDSGQWPRRMQGSKAYQVAMAWAINNNFRLNPDSDLLPVNRLRRTEAMISTYLKYGEKAAIIAPHREQYVGLVSDYDWRDLTEGGTMDRSATGMPHEDEFNARLDNIKDRLWKPVPANATPEQKSAIFRSNLENLVIASSALAERRVPALKDLRITDDGEIEVASTGKRLGLWGPEVVGHLRLPAVADKTGVGDSTSRRAIATRTALGPNLQARVLGRGTAVGGQRVPGSKERVGVLEAGSDRGLELDPAKARLAASVLGKKALYSRDKAPGRGLRLSGLRTELAKAFGQKAADRLIERGIMTAVEKQEDLPKDILRWAREGDRIYGVADGGKTYAVLENLSPEMVRGLALHEIGVHHGFKEMLGEERYNQVMKRLDAMGRAGNKGVQAAKAIAEKEAADASQVPEETLAYLVQNNPELSLVQRVISAIKAWLFRTYGIGASVLTESDLTVLAKAAVLHSVTDAPVISTQAQPEWTAAAAFSRSKQPHWATSEALKSAAGKVETYAQDKPFSEKLKALKTEWKERLVQGMFDAYAPLKKLGHTEYVKARMVKSTDGALEGLLLYGKPVMSDEGVIQGQIDRKGFLGAMQDLKGEHDRFFMWVAGNRADMLMRQGREHLFTPAEIADMRGLSKGKMADGSAREQAYAKAAEVLRQYNKSVLDIAEKTGLIEAESRKAWEHDFYVPFFRVDEDTTISAPSARVKGLVRQQAFKKLKGGTEPLGDLMANTLRNWSHLLSASMANQAAVASLKAAEKIGIAQEVPEGTDGATYAMVNGKKTHYSVEDPFILQAISAMESASFKGLPMKLMGKAKHYLTLGVTVSPTFRIRNLMRDSIAAIGQNDMSYNIMSNLAQGWTGTKRGSDNYAQMLFNGALMRFGQLTDGKHAEHAKRLIASGVSEDTILTGPEKAKAALGKLWDEYQEFGDRMENINRAALYKKLKAEGKNDLEAAFAARDAMDFSLQGAWPAVRFLAQIVPFWNARLQGLYKLGRAVNEDPRRMGYVAGAVALASIALMLAQKDDEEWKKREDWDRDAFWAFRIGDVMYRIPKPFEIGAIGTLAERSVELMISDEMGGKRFAERLKAMVMETFSMNPMPQLFKPLADVYFNKDSFTGRQIETRGMENLSKGERATPYTSLAAKVAGKAEVLSPVQIDHLIRGYFGWLGSHVAMTADMMAQPFMDNAKPARKIDDYFIVGDFAKSLPSNRSRYVEQFYKQSKAIHEVMGDLKQARESQDAAKIQEILTEKKSEVALSKFYASTERRMSQLSGQIRRVHASSKTAEAKRDEIDRLTAMRNQLAKIADERARRVRESVEASPR